MANLTYFTYLRIDMAARMPNRIDTTLAALEVGKLALAYGAQNVLAIAGRQSARCGGDKLGAMAYQSPYISHISAVAFPFRWSSISTAAYGWTALP